MTKISIIVPCHNEQEMIPILYEALDRESKQLSGYDFEFLLVDDGSKDQTMEEIRKVAAQDSRVHYISFSRNFGKESAMYAGLKNAQGDYCVIMDADLQDPPALLKQMIDAIELEGYDSCATRRVTRAGEPPIRSFFARQFYKLMNRASDVDMVDGARDYRMMTRPFVNAILQMGEYNRFSKGIFGWVGFKTKWLEYENVERVAGETKWSFWKLFKYAISGIVSFSTVPLQFASAFGMILSVISFFAIVFIVIRKMLFGDPVAGWPSTICIIMLIGGIQLLSIGILGQYISRTYMEVKDRPIYLCREANFSLNDEKQMPVSSTAIVCDGKEHKTIPLDGGIR